MRELSQDDLNRLTELIHAGQKIEAIKEYKELTGQGLKESKEFIDDLEDQMRDGNPASSLNTSYTARPARMSLGSMPEEDAKKMTELIFTGQKIQAIKMYREAARIGLKESKDFIDALEKQLREECPEKFTHAARSGCGLLLMGGVVALAAAAGWA